MRIFGLLTPPSAGEIIAAAAATVFTGLFILSGIVPADAASRMCAKRGLIAKMLAEKYREAPRAFGLAKAGKLAFEFYVSPSGSWTVTMTGTKGVSCIIAAGNSWQERDPPKGERT